MLVVCNGAFKSGSTWLFNILINITEFSNPTKEYLTENNKTNPCIQPDKLRTFLTNVDYHSKSYISKNHLERTQHKELLLSFSDVLVFNITRDIRDVVVSAYFHERNRHGYDGSFKTYYWTEGRKVAYNVHSYHNIWGADGSKIYVSAFEKLKIDFEAEVKRIGLFLGIELSQNEIEAIKKKTSMETLKVRYKDNQSFENQKGSFFFRKGVIGDWKNHFDEKMTQDIERIKEYGLRKFASVELYHRAMKKISNLKSHLLGQ